MLVLQAKWLQIKALFLEGFIWTFARGGDSSLLSLISKKKVTKEFFCMKCEEKENESKKNVAKHNKGIISSFTAGWCYNLVERVQDKYSL
jgi:hypothetical protein